MISVFNDEHVSCPIECRRKGRIKRADEAKFASIRLATDADYIM